MKKIRLIAAFTAAAMCFQVMTACGKKSESSEEKKKTQTIISAGERSDDTIAAAESSDSQAAPTESSDGWITPAEDSDEYELGVYRISDKGTKLYYDEETYPEELVLALERYFKCFEQKDYSTYCECVYPAYADKMEEFLQKEYGYGLDESFNGQCENLSGNMGGSFEITRIKAEKSEDFETEEEGVESYFKTLDETLGDGFAESIEGECDSFRHMRFYVMAKGPDGMESMLVSGFDIVFAEKDGKYYTFG